MRILDCPLPVICLYIEFMVHLVSGILLRNKEWMAVTLNSIDKYHIYKNKEKKIITQNIYRMIFAIWSLRMAKLTYCDKLERMVVTWGVQCIHWDGAWGKLLKCLMSWPGWWLPGCTDTCRSSLSHTGLYDTVIKHF